MATTQYIGARYVPLFAEPIEWDKTKQYEPLTIVTHEGNSYTSRQFVPTGIEITNETFWALTGNYNAQIEQYRKEVAAYDGRITTAQGTADSAKESAAAATTSAAAATTAAGNAAAAVAEEKTRAEAKESQLQSLADTNKTDITHLDSQMAATTGSELLNKILNETNRATAKERSIETINVALIGDSYTAVDKFYFDKLKKIVPDNVEFTRFASSSIGFVREVSFGDNTNIPNSLSNLVNSSVVYDYIIMYAGINDYNNVATSIYSASNQWGYITITQEVDAIKQTVDIIRNSNAGRTAQLVFLPNSMKLSSVKSTNVTTNDYSYWYHNVINSVANYKGLMVIPNAMSWLMFVGNDFKIDNGYASDNVHPNDAGGYVIASNIASIINGTFTETSWAAFKNTASKTITINNENVDCNMDSSINFDGHTLTLTTIVNSSHSFKSGFSANVDVSNFVDYFIKTKFFNFFTVNATSNGFYYEYLSNNIIGGNHNVLVIKIPNTKPNGSTLAFMLIETLYLC